MRDASNETDDTDKVATLPPLANAGPDREVLRGYRAQLDGTGTWSLDGASLTLSWQQIAGEPVYLSNTSGASPYFIAPLDEQTLTFELTVDNGAFTVTDTVAIVVSNDPRRVAPVVNGGPDQLGDELDTTAFVPSAAMNGQVAITWEEVTPSRAALSGRNSQIGYAGPRIYKLVAVDDGLTSAPDYVLVHPITTDVTAPTTSVTGPTIADTGSAIVLQAAGIGSNLSYHWEQTRGAPVLQTLGEKSSQIGVDVPRVSQQLVFRVHAYDGVLSSAPSEIVLEVVPGSGAQPGQLVPGTDLYARSESTVRLMASAADAADGATFDWEQTRGETVQSSFDVDGVLTFETPDHSGELAFVVESKTADADSPPAAYRVVVRDDEDAEPRIAICLPATILPSETITVSVRVTDPDGDAIDAVYANAEGTDITELGEVFGDCARDISAVVGSSVTRAYTFDAPGAGETLELSIAASDVRGSSGERRVTISP